MTGWHYTCWSVDIKPQLTAVCPLQAQWKPFYAQLQLYSILGNKLYLFTTFGGVWLTIISRWQDSCAERHVLFTNIWSSTVKWDQFFPAYSNKSFHLIYMNRIWFWQMPNHTSPDVTTFMTSDDVSNALGAAFFTFVGGCMYVSNGALLVHGNPTTSQSLRDNPLSSLPVLQDMPRRQSDQ